MKAVFFFAALAIAFSLADAGELRKMREKFMTRTKRFLGR